MTVLRPFRLLPLALAASLVTLQPAHAALEWIGGDGEAWEDGTNWAPAGPPTPADFVEVIFPSGSVAVTDGDALELQTATDLLVDGGSLDVVGTILNQGTLTGSGGATLTAGLVRNGWDGTDATLTLTGTGTSLSVTKGLVNDHVTAVTSAASLTAASFDNTHSFEVASGALAAAVSMQNDAGASLTITGSDSRLTLDGDPNVEGAGALTNRGTTTAMAGGTVDVLSIDNLHTLTAAGGGTVKALSVNAHAGSTTTVTGAGSRMEAVTSLVNRGSLTAGDAGEAVFGSLENHAGATFENGGQGTGGSLDNQAGATLTLRDTGTGMQLSAALTNAGDVDLGPGTSIGAGSYSQSAGETRLDNAALAAASLGFDGGTLLADTTTGGGITGNVFLNPGAELHIGLLDIGRLDIAGDVALDGLALFDIGGAAPTSGYDVLAATGGVAVAGTLEIGLTGGFVPDAADFFDIIHGDSIFLDPGADILFPELAALGFDDFIVDLGGGGQALRLATAAVIPLPPGLLLLASAALLMLPAARRRG